MPNTAAAYDPLGAILTVTVLTALFAATLRRLHRSMRVFLPAPRPPAPADYGLLVSVASAATRADADMLRELLAAHGIRATVAATDPRRPRSGRVEVLVFPDDASRARDLVVTR